MKHKDGTLERSRAVSRKNKNVFLASEYQDLSAEPCVSHGLSGDRFTHIIKRQTKALIQISAPTLFQ